MDAAALSNLGAYAAQVAVIVALAGLLAWLLHINTANVRYGYWRAVFALCLLLPLIQGRKLPESMPMAITGSVVTEIAPRQNPAPLASPTIDWSSLVLPVLVVGAAARLLWLSVSLARLRRLRLSGQIAPESAVHTELADAIGTRPEIRYVPALRQPATFGLFRPVVLLPAALAARSEDIQRAVVSHELVHVKRRDWGWLLIEELVCAMLWFHPAIWWLVSRVHLAREVVVDELAVLVTGRRRAYVEALMAFADDPSRAPVAAFGGRAQLFDRIVLLSKESGMSARRLLFTLVVVAAAVGTGTWQAVQAFPLVASRPQTVRQNAPGPLEGQAKPITPENPIPRRTNYEAPFYPGEASAAGARGSVTLMITLDSLGRVVEARRIGLNVDSQNPKASIRFNNTTPVDEMRFMVNQSQAQSDALRAIAKAFEDAAFRAVQGWRYDPPAAAPVSFAVLLTFSDNPDAQPGSEEAVVTDTPYGRGVRSGDAVRVGGNIRPPTKIKDVRPVYPPEAQAARVRGLVIIEARIGADGSVEDARVLRSIPLLDQAAVDAVMQWRFTPTLLNGKAVPVVMTVTVNFALDDGQRREVIRDPREVSPELRRQTFPEPSRELIRDQPREVTPEARKATRGDAPVVVKEVKPVYTREAMEARVQGSVEVEALIGTDGRVMDAQIVTGDPMLHESSLQAVRRWEFKPIPTPKTVTIELTFSLRSNR
jgi:TonB family protein